MHARSVAISAIPTSAGALWVAPFAGPLARVDARTGRIQARFDPNALPTALAVGDGAEWITDGEGGNVTRVDPTGLISPPIVVGNDPSGIAVDAAGVWVANSGDDTVTRIDPASDAATTTISVGDAPTGVAVGDGSVWVADSGDGTVTRIDESTHATRTIMVGGSPQSIIVSRGRAWVTVDARALPASAGPASGGTLRVVTEGDIASSMDPALAYDMVADQLLYATCAKLVNYPDRSGPAGLEIVPEVAQSLPLRSADGRTYTFKIRRGFRFAPRSNAPVTAETFKVSIDRALSHRMHSPVAAEYSDIVGAAAYIAGRSKRLSGVTAHGDTLTIRLVAPAPDLLTRLAEPAMCAVPPDTPWNPAGVRDIPSAGPYTVTSWIPGQGVVLSRNPNYHGTRPHRPAQIDVALGFSARRAIADVESGSADYANADPVPNAAVARQLAARYGAGSPAAKAGHQQYFVSPSAALDFFALNTHRRLFASRRMRQAVSYAIDRTALAARGDEFDPLPEQPASHYLPPAIPGYRGVAVYPSTPALPRARALAATPPTTTAVLYTCSSPPCPQQAQIVRTDLAAIGIDVKIDTFPQDILNAKLAMRNAGFDLAWEAWAPDYPEPEAMLDELLEDPLNIPTFVGQSTKASLAQASRLTGPERTLNYGALDLGIASTQAPLLAFGNPATVDLFSARIGCQTYTGAFGMDLGALCIRAPVTARSRGATR